MMEKGAESEHYEANVTAQPIDGHDELQPGFAEFEPRLARWKKATSRALP